MTKRREYMPSPFPEALEDDGCPFAWRNLLATVDPQGFESEADQAKWCLARHHRIPPWEAEERLRNGFIAGSSARH